MYPEKLTSHFMNGGQLYPWLWYTYVLKTYCTSLNNAWHHVLNVLGPQLGGRGHILKQPTREVYLRQGLSNHTIPEACEQHQQWLLLWQRDTSPWKSSPLEGSASLTDGWRSVAKSFVGELWEPTGSLRPKLAGSPPGSTVQGSSLDSGLSVDVSHCCAVVSPHHHMSAPYRERKYWRTRSMAWG